MSRLSRAVLEEAGIHPAVRERIANVPQTVVARQALDVAGVAHHHILIARGEPQRMLR